MEAHGPLPREMLSAATWAIVSPEVPAATKLLAARGAAPLQPADNLAVFYQLAHGDDANLAENAIGSMCAVPVQLAAAGLREAADPRIIDFVARRRVNDVELIEDILLNPRSADETVEFLANIVNERHTEIIASNQMQMLRRPKIIEALYMNPNTRMSTVNRCVEFAVREGVVLDGIPAFQEIAAAILGTVPGAASDEQPQEAGQEDLDRDVAEVAAEWSAEMDDDEAFLMDVGFGEALREEEGSDKSIEARIRNMTVMEKIRLATLGDSIGRGMLVRDRNRLVCMAAIKSPRVTEQEVSKYAQSRVVSEEVIRHIAYSREMTRSYQVKASLATNPKTPLPVAIKFLPHLRERELRALTRNKNVAQVLTVQARQVLRRRRK